MDVKTALDALTKKNVPRQRETNGCMFPKVSLRSVRSPMKIS